MFKNPNLAPDPAGRACIAPQGPDLISGGEGTRGPLSNNPTAVLGPSIRPRFDGSQSLTHYKVVNHKYDCYTTTNAQ